MVLQPGQPVLDGCRRLDVGLVGIELYDDFTRFVRGFGYFFEFGHAWSVGFCPVRTAPSRPGTHIFDLDGRSTYTAP